MDIFIKLNDIDGFLNTLNLPAFCDTNGWESDFDTQESKHCYTIGLEKIYIYDVENNNDVLRVKTW